MLVPSVRRYRCGMPVRHAVPGDAAALAVVHVRTWQAAYAGLIRQDHLDSLDPAQREPGWRRWLTGLRPPAAILIWGDGVTPDGFVAVQPSRDPDADPAVTGEITAIYLLPAHQGSGAGRELMTAAVDHLTSAGFRRATLWVLTTNARARRFYEAAGWSADGASKVDTSHGFPLEEVRYGRTLDGS
ncbi:acetyltransferase (GNAT) family protein [Actinoplanes xinjiangensis]|uniref:Acetyltransferase (GNAT) family protein n=2 Tax=Actinoplanes xinjiangensis TaxID=512350 RepID=A0A316EII6_9ACTN|nr:acetyltransferase (GNAT) family protein [Actinoplanes xinjiangensis]GIF44085.1 N-acetyltransferase [Actinoplanes xinjiangensis]